MGERKNNARRNTLTLQFYKLISNFHIRLAVNTFAFEYLLLAENHTSYDVSSIPCIHTCFKVITINRTFVEPSRHINIKIESERSRCCTNIFVLIFKFSAICRAFMREFKICYRLRTMRLCNS